MTGFSSLNTAVTGLAAAQRAMDTTGQNIVNANTPGYSRQRVDLKEVGSSPAASYWSGHGEPQAGVTVAGVSRLRSSFVEATRAAAGGRQAALTSQTDTLTAVQTSFAEPGATGLQNTMDALYASWHDLSLHPGDVAAGSVVIQRGLAVTDQLRSLSNGVVAQWNSAHESLSEVVAQVDQAAKDLADVNGKVGSAKFAGLPVNELEDQRDLLTRKLATLIGGTATIGSDGEATVSVNGVALVSGGTAQQFTLAGPTSLSGVSGSTTPMIMWNGVRVPVDSGAAAGHLAVLGADLPNTFRAIDSVAADLVATVNAVHRTGFTATGTTGVDFFSGTDAASIGVVPTDPSELAVAAAAGKVDGTVAQKLGDLSDELVQQAQLGRPGPSTQWRNLTTSLGVRVQSLKDAGAVQDNVVAAADAAVQTDSGVNIDEEMTNMLQYQRAYQAAARVVSTVDEILDTLINRTGRS